MIDTPAPAARPLHRPPESYTVEFGQLLGGDIQVALTATMIDEEEAELLLQEIAIERVKTLDDALAIVRASVHFS